MKRIRTALDYNPDIDSHAEENPGKSLTVPDMTLTLAQLVARYTRSGTFGDVATFEPVFNGEAELPDVTKMDALEKLEYARNIKGKLTEYQASIRKQKADATKLEKQAQKEIEQKEPEPKDTDVKEGE